MTAAEATWVGALSLSGAGAPVITVANSHSVKLATGAEFPFPGGSAPLQPESILPVDFNYDFKTDLVLAGEGGVRFLRQESPTSFTDVTAQTKLPPALLNAPYTGAWAIDVEADGDMDIVLGAQAAPVVLRNNGDGTFTAIHPFARIAGLRGFAWVDLDGDGNPDAAMIDGSGGLHFFHNQRGGVFQELALPGNLPPVKAVTVADVSGTGTLALVAVEETGALVAITRTSEGWNVAQLGNAPRLAEEVRLHAADLDNNGVTDLLVTPVALKPGDPAGALLWLGNGGQKFTLLPAPVGPARVLDVADLNADGRLDLLGLSADGQVQQALNHGSKKYQWQILRPRARVATGDQRINSFGIGGEMELRAGLLVQKQPITSPQLHFGLGEQSGTDVVRIQWPNGMENAEFALQADQEVLTEQRLKGSCPFLFAWNGKQIGFVKDAVPWGSALGLQIDSVGSSTIAATEEWYKIGRDQLVPRDGYYDLRLTGELWETYYYDYLKLMVVDHPAGTEILTDERFVIPPVKLAITAVAPPHAIAKAVDDRGADVTAIVSQARWPVPRYLRARSIPGPYPRSLCGGGPGQRRTGERAVVADRQRMGTPDRLLGKRRYQPGTSPESPCSQPRSPGWARRMAHRPGEPGISGGPQEDLPHQSGECLPARHPAQAAPANQPRSLLGFDRVGAGPARYSAQGHAIGSVAGRSSLPRIFRWSGRPMLLLPSCPTTTASQPASRYGVISRVTTLAMAMSASYWPPSMTAM